jgi:hypothetical protein
MSAITKPIYRLRVEVLLMPRKKRHDKPDPDSLVNIVKTWAKALGYELLEIQPQGGLINTIDIAETVELRGQIVSEN